MPELPDFAGGRKAITQTRPLNVHFHTSGECPARLVDILMLQIGSKEHFLSLNFLCLFPLADDLSFTQLIDYQHQTHAAYPEIKFCK